MQPTGAIKRRAGAVQWKGPIPRQKRKDSRLELASDGGMLKDGAVSRGARSGRGFNWRDNPGYANELLAFVREIAVFTFERSGGLSAARLAVLARPAGCILPARR